MAVVPARLKTHSSAQALYRAAKLLILLMICIQATFCWMARARSLRGEVDLRTFYTAGLTVREGNAHHLYDPATEAHTQQVLFAGQGRTLPFLYPAFAAVFFVPLSLLPYPAAFFALLLTNLLFLFLSARLLAPSVSGLSTGWLFALFLAFFPTSIALMQGQISPLLLLVFAGAHRLAGKGSYALSGLCLSLALVKFQLALPLIVMLLLRRWNPRLLRGFLAGASLLLAASLLFAGLEGTRGYLVRLHGVSSTMLLDHAAAQARFAMQTSDEPTLHGLFARLAGPGLLGILLWLGCSACAVVAAVRSSSAVGTLPAAMLASYHLQPYDLTLLLLPATLLLLGPARATLLRQRPAAWLAFAALAALSIPIGPLLLTTDNTAWFALPVAALLAASTRLALPERRAHEHPSRTLALPV